MIYYLEWTMMGPTMGQSYFAKYAQGVFDHFPMYAYQFIAYCKIFYLPWPSFDGLFKLNLQTMNCEMNLDYDSHST